MTIPGKMLQLRILSDDIIEFNENQNDLTAPIVPMRNLIVKQSKECNVICDQIKIYTTVASI